MTVRNNVFFEQTTDYAVEVWAAYGSAQILVEHNSFLSTDRVALVLPSGYSSAAMSAPSNWWNTTDTSEIDGMIFDQNDDLSSAGLIDYSGYLGAPHADTPDPTLYIQ